MAPSGDCSVRFYYYLYGKDVGTLMVQTRGVVNGEVTVKGVGGWLRVIALPSGLCCK